MKQLPNNILLFTSSLYTFFNCSPKRQQIVIEFQVFLDAEINKILSRTRWLSLKTSISMIIEQWDVLQLYFTYGLSQENIELALFRSF